MYFSLIAGEGEERKEMLSTAHCNEHALCVLETFPWGFTSSKVSDTIAIQTRRQFIVQFLGHPMQMVTSQNQTESVGVVYRGDKKAPGGPY